MSNQNTIVQILDDEMDLVRSAPERYGQYFAVALECSLQIPRFIKSIDIDRWVFGSFLSQVRKHHLLAVLSTVRLHKVQSMMNLRQTIEAGACAAFAIAHPDYNHFVDKDEDGILNPSQELTKKRYKWLEDNYPDESNAIKEIKRQINTATAHANLISGSHNFYPDYEANKFATPFFDVEDKYFVKADLWLISNAALNLLHLFSGVNKQRNVIKFTDNFLPMLEILAERNELLRTEIMASERYNRVRETIV